MVAARKPRARVHSLPHDGPFAISRDHERVQIQLEAVADRVVVHDSRLVRASVFPSTPVRSPNCFSSFGVSREWRPRPPQITIPRSKRALIPRFNAPITDVVIPEECQSIPMTQPNAWNQKGSLKRDRNPEMPEARTTCSVIEVPNAVIRAASQARVRCATPGRRYRNASCVHHRSKFKCVEEGLCRVLDVASRIVCEGSVVRVVRREPSRPAMARLVLV